MPLFANNDEYCVAGFWVCQKTAYSGECILWKSFPRNTHESWWIAPYTPEPYILPMWVLGTGTLSPGMCTYEQLGHTWYQIISNTWYQVRRVTGYQRLPSERGYRVPGKSGERVLRGGYLVRMVTRYQVCVFRLIGELKFLFYFDRMSHKSLNIYFNAICGLRRAIEIKEKFLIRLLCKMYYLMLSIFFPIKRSSIKSEPQKSIFGIFDHVWSIGQWLKNRFFFTNLFVNYAKIDVYFRKNRRLFLYIIFLKLNLKLA